MAGEEHSHILYVQRPTTCTEEPMCTMVLSRPIVEPTKSPTTDRSKQELPGQ